MSTAATIDTRTEEAARAAAEILSPRQKTGEQDHKENASTQNTFDVPSAGNTGTATAPTAGSVSAQPA